MYEEVYKELLEKVLKRTNQGLIVDAALAGEINRKIHPESYKEEHLERLASAFFKHLQYSNNDQSLGLDGKWR